MAGPAKLSAANSNSAALSLQRSAKKSKLIDEPIGLEPHCMPSDTSLSDLNDNFSQGNIVTSSEDTPRIPSESIGTTMIEQTEQNLNVSSINELDLLWGTLGYTIKRAQMRSIELLASMIAPSGLTPAKMTALSLIGVEPGISQSALAEKLKINRASVVKVIDTLESLNFVKRQSTPGDRRSYSLEVTASGQKCLTELHARIQEFEAKISKNLTNSERKMLIELLEKVAPLE